MPGIFIPFSALVTRIMSFSPRCKTLLVGIDGCGASGKSTFAKILQAAMPKVTVVQMDDFFLPSTFCTAKELATVQIGVDFDWLRMRHQVLEPLLNNTPGYYQRYDWESDKLSGWHTVPTGGIVIIEGVYSTRKELAELYDIKIWVDCPYDLRLARGLERDGEEAKDRWETDWMPAESNYLENHKPNEAADLVVDGSISLPSQTTQFGCIRVKEGFLKNL